MMTFETSYTPNLHAATADLVRAFLAKGRKVKLCQSAYAISAAPSEHTGGLDRYQFRAFVRVAKGA